MLRVGLWFVLVALTGVAGWTDWRWRRIPNWLTVPGAMAGVTLSAIAYGWAGTRESLLGVALGLALLLPFVLVRSLGAGDWKLVGMVGAYLGPRQLVTVLLGSILVAGAMAVALIVAKKRAGQTVRNIGRILAAFVTLRLPARDLTLDNPESLKVPFGVAVAITVTLYAAGHAWGKF